MIRIFLLLLLTVSCAAQQNDLDFLVQKIKTNYPGYAEKTKYIDFDSLVSRAVKQHSPDTFKIMASIIDFFGDRHLDLFRMPDLIDTQQCNRNFSEVKSYLGASRPKKKYEGYWLSEAGHCVMAIRQTSKEPLSYTGYVVANEPKTGLYPGLVFCELQRNATGFFGKIITSTTRMGFYARCEFRNDSVLTTGPYNKWKKITRSDFPRRPLKSKVPEQTTGRWLGDSTYLITIPTSTAKNGEILDSLLKSDTMFLRRAANLIVDMRSNTGGTVNAYAALLPLLYTNPILKVNTSVYGTVDEANKIRKDIADYIASGGTDSAYIKSWLDFAKLESDSAGKFIPMPRDTLTLPKVLPLPRNIGIIINFGNQSAAEIFLLDAMQSTKVKLFGEHTMGAVDYLDFYPQTSPSGRYKLYIATTRRTIPPGGTKLDGKGISPDVPISDQQKDWVDFVKRYYENN